MAGGDSLLAFEILRPHIDDLEIQLYRTVRGREIETVGRGSSINVTWLYSPDPCYLPTCTNLNRQQLHITTLARLLSLSLQCPLETHLTAVELRYYFFVYFLELLC